MSSAPGFSSEEETLALAMSAFCDVPTAAIGSQGCLGPWPEIRFSQLAQPTCYLCTFLKRLGVQRRGAFPHKGQGTILGHRQHSWNPLSESRYVISFGIAKGAAW